MNPLVGLWITWSLVTIAFFALVIRRSRLLARNADAGSEEEYAGCSWTATHEPSLDPHRLDYVIHILGSLSVVLMVVMIGL
jgi:hypothetical protein